MLHSGLLLLLLLLVTFSIGATTRTASGRAAGRGGATPLVNVLSAGRDPMTPITHAARRAPLRGWS